MPEDNFAWGGGADRSNHDDGFYNVGFYDGSIQGVSDPGYAKTRDTTYYAGNIYTWLEEQCR
ncbi:MAG: hypothetical protein KGZ25_00595 [Planctomycetes bacterium]|nr:hypothetical protein [Planctomycetota bacterium]